MMTTRERQRYIAALNALVQMGLVDVAAIVNGEPCYRLAAGVRIVGEPQRAAKRPVVDESNPEGSD